MTWEWDAGTDNERCFSNIENDTHYQNNQLLYLSEIITHHFPIVLLWPSICFSVPTLTFTYYHKIKNIRRLTHFDGNVQKKQFNLSQIVYKFQPQTSVQHEFRLKRRPGFMCPL